MPEQEPSAADAGGGEGAPAPRSQTVEPRVGQLVAQLDGIRVNAYGRVDSREAMDRARYSAQELERLDTVLATLTDTELAAYSVPSAKAGTFLMSKGHAFAVLTDAQLAAAYRREIERRDAAKAVPAAKPREGFWDGTGKWLFRAVLAAGLATLAKIVFGI